MAKKRRSRTETATMRTMSAKQLAVTFATWLIGHSAVIWFASRFFPQAVVLGNHMFSPIQALFYSMIVFTLIAVGAIPIIEHLAVAQRKALKTLDWVVIFFVVDAVGLWVVARFAEQLGLGIASWVTVIALAIVIDATQGLIATKSM